MQHFLGCSRGCLGQRQDSRSSARRAHDTFTLLPAGPERRFGISRISGRDALSPYSRVGVIGLLRRLSAQLWFRAVFRTSFSGGGQCLLSASVSYAARRGQSNHAPGFARRDGALSVCAGCLWEEAFVKGPLISRSVILRESPSVRLKCQGRYSKA